MTVPADDAVHLAKGIERLCDDTAACMPIGMNARAMFEAEYSQSMVMGKWREVLTNVSR